jgi:hypothetical protein
VSQKCRWFPHRSVSYLIERRPAGYAIVIPNTSTKAILHCADIDDMEHRPTSDAGGIAGELSAWRATGLRLIVWGGDAESAAFLETHGLDAERFPIVVDSDPRRISTFVHGAGQLILSPAWLLENPVDIILIPSPRRAEDAVRQIDAAHIPYEFILLPKEGHLVDFHATRMIFA